MFPIFYQSKNFLLNYFSFRMNMTLSAKIWFCYAVIRALTLSKFFNLIKIFFHYWGKHVRINIFKPMPYFSSIELTTACNLRCPHCISGLRSFARPTGSIKMDTFKKIIRSIRHHCIFVNLYYMGEPMLHPYFFHFVRMARTSGILPIVSTNAHFLTMETAEKMIRNGLFMLIISLDGVSQETYSKYRIGGNISKVMEGIESIVAAKRKLGSALPIVVLQMVVGKHNQHEVANFIKLAKEKGLSYSIKTMNVLYDEEKWLPDNEELVRRKAAKRRGCLRHISGCVFTWDGNILPCCYDHNGFFTFGNIKYNNFEEIWWNGKGLYFKELLWKGREKIGICWGCPEGRGGRLYVS